MLRIFITSLIFILVAKASIYGQNSLNDSLMTYEYNYFNCKNDSLRQVLLIRKINLYLKQGVTDSDVLKEMKRVDVNKLSDPILKQNFFWNAAVVSYLNEETDRSKFYLAQYKKSSVDSSVAYNLLLLLANRYSDTSLVNNRLSALSLKDSSFRELDCFADVVHYNRKHLNFYLISSLILPGSGAIMNGYVFKGLVSMALTAGSVYGIVKLVQYSLYINAVLWGGGVGLKFYFGNVKLTEELFYKAETRQKNKLAKNCELTLKKILQKYPLTLKY